MTTSRRALIELNLDPRAPDAVAPYLGPVDIALPAFQILPRGRPTVASVLSSVGAHVATGLLVVFVAPLLAPDPLPKYALRRIPAGSIELLLPPLHSPSPPPAPRPQQPKAEGQKGRKGPKGAAPEAAPLARPRFELPPQPVRTKTDLTLIQPPTEADVAIPQELRLPPIMQWSVIPKAKMPPKRFVTPGNVSTNRQIPQLEAPPKLEMPNAVPVVRELKIAGGVIVDKPALPVSPATTMPVRTFVPPPEVAPTAPAALQITEGDELNLIAIGSQPVKELGSIRLPPGSQVAGIHDIPAPANPALVGGSAEQGQGAQGADAAGDRAGAGSPDGGGAGQGGGRQAAGMGGGSAGRGSGSAGAGSGTRGAGTGASSGGSASGTRSGSGSAPGSGPAGPGGTGTRVNSLASGAGTSAGDATEMLRANVPIRIEHPENRAFDVVVVQSSATPHAAAAGILSGSPIYTVYVPVGTSRLWIMQYCVPTDTAIRKREGIAYQLGNPAPVKAPYPRITVAPPRWGREEVVMHGFITELGEFSELRVVSGKETAEDLMVLPLLQHWVFRPATRDGRPIAVEFVLVIPTDRG